MTFTNHQFQGAVPLDYFTNGGDIQSCDIKYVASRYAQKSFGRRKAEAEIKSLLQKWAVLRQKSRFHSDNAEQERLDLMSQASQER